MTPILSRIFDIFLKVFIAGATFFYWPGMMAYEPQEMFIQYGVFILFALSLIVPAKREISNYTLGLLLLYATLNTFFVSFTPHARITLLNFFLGILAIKIIAERVDFDFKSKGKLFLALIGFNFLFLALQYFKVDPVFSSVMPQNMPQVDTVGLMGIRFALGALAALVLPFVFSINPWICLTLLPLFYFSKASTTIVAGAVTFLFLMYFKNTRVVIRGRDLGRIFWWMIAAVIPLAIWYVCFKDLPTGQFEKRLHIWFAGISVLKMKYIFGYGLGGWSATNFVGIQQNGMGEKWVWTHSEPIQFFYEQGLIGCVFLYAYFKRIWKHLHFDKEGQIVYASLLSLILISLCHFPLHIGRLAGISIWIFALVEAYIHEVKKRNDEEPLRVSDL